MSASSQPPVEVSSGPSRPKKPQVCRFYSTKNGCRAGDACPFLHQSSAKDPSNPPSQASVAGSKSQHDRQSSHTPVVDRSRIVQRPKPQVDDPRAFQISQIKRRFSPEISSNDDNDTLKFKLVPSDPDFPFELDSLDCLLQIPKTLPGSGKPSLRILNKEIPRGFQINIERGFDTIVSRAPNATLLALMNQLDKQLETILSGEMAETIKLVAHRGPQQGPNTVAPDPVQQSHSSIPKQQPQKIPIFTAEEKAAAKGKRQADTRQLEARFGRLQSFAKSADGFSYTLPLDSPKRSTWPATLQTLRSFTLLLPQDYPLDQPSIMLDSDSVEARNVENSFRRRVATERNATLTQFMNYLTINLKDMSQRQEDTIAAPKIVTSADTADSNAATKQPGPDNKAIDKDDEDKPHIHIIPRPPEWTQAYDRQGDSDSDSDPYDSYDTGDDTEGVDTADEDSKPTMSTPVERGILLSFPQLELYGIELLELTSLSVTVKCDRCKDTMDVERLRNNAGDSTSDVRDVSCKKCANALAIGFRADLIHSNSVRAGYLDLDGCSVVDMLPR